MNKIKIRVNIDGLCELRQSEGVRNLIDTTANKVVGALGDGYEIEKTYVSGGLASRYVSKVHCATAESYYRNLKHNTIEKVINSMRV